MKCFILFILAIVLCVATAQTNPGDVVYLRLDYEWAKEFPINQFYGIDGDESANTVTQDAPMLTGKILLNHFLTALNSDIQSFFPVPVIRIAGYWSSRSRLSLIVVAEGGSQFDDFQRGMNTEEFESTRAYIVSESNENLKKTFAGYTGHADILNVRATPGQYNSACGNGVQDRQESDTDCGGDCAPCNMAQKCNTNSDCSTTSGTPCVDGLCAFYNSSSAVSMIGATVAMVAAVVALMF